MANLQLAPSVRDLRGEAIEAIANRTARIDLTPLFVYRIDSVPASALLFLGWQFDLLSPLWQLVAPADPDLSVEDAATAAKRALLKSGIALHSKNGVVATLKRALASLGWPNAIVLEGQDSWGGDAYPSDQGWAVFRIKLNMWTLGGPGDFDAASAGGDDDFDELSGIGGDFDEISEAASPIPISITAAQVAQIVAAAEFFKAARDVFDAVVMVFAGVTDILSPAPSDGIGAVDILSPAPTDFFTVTFPIVIIDIYALPATHDRRFTHAGITYANGLVGPSDGACTFNGVPVEGSV